MIPSHGGTGPVPSPNKRWASVCLLGLAILLSLTGCAGSRHFHSVERGAASGVPRWLELRRSAQVATLHFPAGVYEIEAADDRGFFYRAPQQIRENSFQGARFHDGGVYLSKSPRRTLRGYVDWYNGLVHVGDLSHADYLLRD